MERSSAILLPVSSLPSKGGIGTFGKDAYDFLKFLKKSGVKIWQMLPLGPTGYGDSPYSPLSSFAGNTYFIDPEMLYDEKLLSDAEYKEALDFTDGPVEYGRIYEARKKMLSNAYARRAVLDKEFVEYKLNLDKDIKNYAMFLAFKEKNDNKAWFTWKGPERDILKADAAVTGEIADRIDYHIFCQFLFDRHFSKLKAKAEELGIQLMGDIPFYAATDSADVWADPQCFRLKEDGSPKQVAGVPPDYFSEDGQLWGNPLYDWDVMKKDGYSWMKRRFAAAARRFDILRLDHFRGYESFWCVEAGEETAKGGKWEKGPDKDFVDFLKKDFPDTYFIAEDLGSLTDEVVDLLRYSGFPGMKVLEFGFFEGSTSDYLPQNHVKTSVVYTGTHDNDTLVGWMDKLPEKDKLYITKYLGMCNADALIRSAYMSVADLAIIPMADWLELGTEARINTPGTDTGNWSWRLMPGQLTDKLSKSIAEYCDIYLR